MCTDGWPIIILRRLLQSALLTLRHPFSFMHPASTELPVVLKECRPKNNCKLQAISDTFHSRAKHDIAFVVNLIQGNCSSSFYVSVRNSAD